MEKRTAGTLTTYKIRYEDPSKHYADWYNNFIELLQPSFPTLKLAYHKDGHTYFQIKSNDETLFNE